LTEAVKAMCDWALNQPDVKTVIAETDTDNQASHRVLEKCGMQQYEQTNGSIRWKLSK
jgi:RimJ/RimL family protein N-acetyltransferase